MPLRCKFNHAHPPEPLMAATENLSQPARPYHCPKCSELTKLSVKDSNWIHYPDFTSAEKAGHFRACKKCFPNDGSQEIDKQLHHSSNKKKVKPNVSEVVTVDQLAKWRRQLLRILDELDKQITRESGLTGRIIRLRNECRIPRDTASQMLLLTEVRNVAEYEGREPTLAASHAVRNAWLSIVEWAHSQGIGGEIS